MALRAEIDEVRDETGNVLFLFIREISTYRWSVQNETELVNKGANEPTQVTNDSGVVYR